MELKTLLNDMSPEELEPRLELQILVDPLNGVSPHPDGNVVNCQKGSTCEIK